MTPESNTPAYESREEIETLLRRKMRLHPPCSPQEATPKLQTPAPEEPGEEKLA
jgi:hypothetical protein